MKAKHFLMVGMLSLSVLMTTSCIHEARTLSPWESGPQVSEKRLMNDFEILVPQFVKKTDRIIVNTKTGEYVGRLSK